MRRGSCEMVISAGLGGQDLYRLEKKSFSLQSPYQVKSWMETRFLTPEGSVYWRRKII